MKKHVLEREEFEGSQMDWRNIRFVKLGTDDNLMYLGVILPGEERYSPDIELTIQVIHGFFYQPHITIKERLRKMGLATKIYRALIQKLGHLYSGKGRRLNPVVDSIWAKLKTDPTIDCANSEVGDACWRKGHEDGPTIKEFIEG
jgi:hypothetical protein